MLQRQERIRVIEDTRRSDRAINDRDRPGLVSTSSPCWRSVDALPETPVVPWPDSTITIPRLSLISSASGRSRQPIRFATSGRDTRLPPYYRWRATMPLSGARWEVPTRSTWSDWRARSTPSSSAPSTVRPTPSTLFLRCVTGHSPAGITAWLAYTLSKQKKNDYRPKDEELSFARNNTEPCTLSCEFLETVRDSSREGLSGKNAEVFLTEVGVSFHTYVQTAADSICRIMLT